MRIQTILFFKALHNWHYISLIGFTLTLFFGGTYWSEKSKLHDEKVHIDHSNENDESSISHGPSTSAIKEDDMEKTLAVHYSYLTVEEELSWILPYHLGVLKDQRFLIMLRDAISKYPTAHEKIFQPFVRESGFDELNILEILVDCENANTTSISITCRGFTKNSASLLNSAITSTYQDYLLEEDWNTSIVPNFVKIRKKVDSLKEKIHDLKQHLRTKSDTKKRNIEDIALNSEMKEMENEKFAIRSCLLQVEALHRKNSSLTSYLEVERIKKYGDIAYLSNNLNSLKTMLDEKQNDSFFREELTRNITLIKKRIQEEIVAAIKDLKENSKQILLKQDVLNQRLTDLELSQVEYPGTKHSQLKIYEDEFSASMSILMESWEKWNVQKNSFIIKI